MQYLLIQKPTAKPLGQELSQVFCSNFSVFKTHFVNWKTNKIRLFIILPMVPFPLDTNLKCQNHIRITSPKMSNSATPSPKICCMVQFSNSVILDQSFISLDEKCLISLVKGLQDQFIIPPCQALRYIYKNGGCMLWFPLHQGCQWVE